jgi:Family of unknown function (DUF6152)
MTATKMTTKMFGVLAAALGLAVSVPAFAHHSFAAEYDGTKPITLKGVVTKMDWVNPHSWIHIDVKGPDGKVINWACETAPPNGLYREGWRRDSLKPGDQVVIKGFLAKDGSATMNARSVTLADGREMFTGTSGDGGPTAGFNGKK